MREMGAEDSRKNLNITAKPLGLKKNKENIEVKEEKKKNKSSGRKIKLLGDKKRKNGKINKAEFEESDKLYNEVEEGFDGQSSANAAGEKKKSKLREKKSKNKKIKKAEIDKVNKLCNEVEDGCDEQNDDGKVGESHSEAQCLIEISEQPKEADSGTNSKTRKSKKAHKTKKKDRPSLKEDEKLLEKIGEAEQDEVYQISSGDEDCSRGMKKWITEYYQSRPGLKILQERIDDFISAHEAQEEQAREEREARAAEGGWTVVVHHKGRKKTTDSESGVTVGSVAPAAVLDKMAKKKSKEVGLDFYRFQKREAQRNEIMMLQSKFEQDKKRIQQLRAARKFRPY
uniref:Ribosomal RNA-processing protein 7 C-terminal domain-containing protein n=1 Tax=Davidia involucrata TaxID=16924 RepID=A0A5B7BSF7_DAVIN